MGALRNHLHSLLRQRARFPVLLDVVAHFVPRNLSALSLIYGTDKSMRSHGYTVHYSAHLKSKRRKVKRVLEIGVGGLDSPSEGGRSLLMWRTYLPCATIYGLDIHKKELPPKDRIEIVEGDQANRGLLQELIRKFGPFDLVIDDGSHVGSDQRASFSTLFPSLPPGALYVIEDLETSYWPKWGGGPAGTDGTGVSLVKDLIDSVHLGPDAVASLHIYPEIAFVEKGAVPRTGNPQPGGASE